jgi:hypothetical protein
MRRIALLVTLFASLAATAHAGPVKDACMGVDPRLGGPCRGAEVLAAEGSALCRYAGVVPDESCATPITPRVSRRLIDAYEGSWLHRTLAFQHELGNALPFANAFWLGTHNSFNSASEPFTPSGMDSNQQVSLTDQLRMDVRSLELDVHFVPSPWAGGAGAPVACHGRGEDELHAGCTTERLFADRLQEIAAWLDAHPRQVILLYVEDHLGDAGGHAQGAAALRTVLGDRIHRTGATGGACRQLPATLTRDDVLAAGAQVVVMGGCGVGDAWRALSFGDADRAANESGGSDAFRGYPTCDPGRSQAYFDAHFIRYFEDSTGLSAGVAFTSGEAPEAGITPEKAAAMTRCGVDLTGFDQLLPDDGRLAALAWSWAEGEPRAGAGECIVERADARLYAERCGDRHAFACQAADGTWSVDGERGRYRAGRDRCAGSAFAIPRRGVEAQRLRDAMGVAGVDAVWVRAGAGAAKRKRSKR